MCLLQSIALIAMATYMCTKSGIIGGQKCNSSVKTLKTKNKHILQEVVPHVPLKNAHMNTVVSVDCSYRTW